jgi:hypothetical protein
MVRRNSSRYANPSFTNAASRKLAFEQFESRLVMDHAMSIAIPWEGESNVFFEGATATVQHGRDLFVIDVSESTPKILSTTSFDNYPAAVARAGQELTLVMSSDLGTSEILIYDISNPLNPVEKSSQLIKGAVTRAWIADEQIVLFTIDPSEFPEPIDEITIDELGNTLDWSVQTEPMDIKIPLENPLLPGEDPYAQRMTASDSNPSWTIPEVTLQIYDRDRIIEGPIIHQKIRDSFDEILMIPDGMITLSSTLMMSDQSGNSIPWTEIDSNHDESTSLFTTTVLSRWKIDESNQSIECLGDYTLQGGYPHGAITSAIIDGTAYLFLLTAKDANPWDLTLNRFRLGDKEPWDHSELDMLELAQNSWFQDFQVEGKTGVITTSSQLLTVDLFSESAPTLLNTFDFPDEMSTWKQLHPGRWLRVSNPHKSDGGIDDQTVSLEVLDLLNGSFEIMDKTTQVADRGLAWSCFAPSAFTFLPDTGVLIANVQQSKEPTEKRLELDTVLAESTTNPIPAEDFMNLHPIELTDWHRELFLFRMDPMGRFSNLGSVKTPSEVIQLNEFGDRVSVLTDREILIIDLKSPNLSTFSITFFQPIDPYEALGIDRNRLVDVLYQVGLGFIDPLMERKKTGNAEDLGFEKTTLDGGVELISITIGSEQWKIHMAKNGISELMVDELQTTSEMDPQPDVNGDGIVDKSDISMLISNINQRGFYPKPTVVLDAANRVFMDVDGDGWLSPFDPLMVINCINIATALHDRPSTDSKAVAVGPWNAPGSKSDPPDGIHLPEHRWDEILRDKVNTSDTKQWLRSDATDYFMSNLIDFQTDGKPSLRVLTKSKKQESELESSWDESSQRLEESLLDKIASSFA